MIVEEKQKDLELYLKSRFEQFGRVLQKATIPGVSPGRGNYERIGERGDKGGTHQNSEAGGGDPGVYVDNAYNRMLGRVGKPYNDAGSNSHPFANYQEVKKNLVPGSFIMTKDGTKGKFIGPVKGKPYFGEVLQDNGEIAEINFSHVNYFQHPDQFKVKLSMDNLAQKYISGTLPFNQLQEHAKDYSIDPIKFAQLLQFHADKKGLKAGTPSSSGGEKIKVDKGSDLSKHIGNLYGLGYDPNSKDEVRDYFKDEVLQPLGEHKIQELFEKHGAHHFEAHPNGGITLSREGLKNPKLLKDINHFKA